MDMIYTATVKVLTPQLVHCVHCGCEYIYEMERIGTGSAECGTNAKSRAAAKRVAEDTARKNLANEIQNSDVCDAVPCRDCYLYQPYMSREAARRKFGQWRHIVWVFRSLAICFLLMAALLEFAASEHDGAAILCGFGLAFLLFAPMFTAVHRHMLATYDPNREPELERHRVAFNRAMSRLKFHELQMMRLRQAYKGYAATVRIDQWESGQEVKIKPLDAILWVEQPVFAEGARVSIKLSATTEVVVVIPPDSASDDEFEVVVESGKPVPFKVRVMPIAIHPDEELE